MLVVQVLRGHTNLDGEAVHRVPVPFYGLFKWMHLGSLQAPFTPLIKFYLKNLDFF